MTCRDLMVYILENGLEDEPIIDETGVIVGFSSIEMAAVELEVGIPTIYALLNQNNLDYIVVGGVPLITLESIKKRKEGKI